MARITVEDCLENVANRFSLVLVSAHRTKQLLRGSAPMIENGNENKEVVLALREIAAGKVRVDDSGVLNHDAWLPHHRKDAALPVADDELPPDADELPPEA